MEKNQWSVWKTVHLLTGSLESAHSHRTVINWWESSSSSPEGVSREKEDIPFSITLCCFRKHPACVVLFTCPKEETNEWICMLFLPLMNASNQSCNSYLLNNFFSSYGGVVGGREYVSTSFALLNGNLIYTARFFSCFKDILQRYARYQKSHWQLMLKKGCPVGHNEEILNYRFPFNLGSECNWSSLLQTCNSCSHSKLPGKF